MPRLGTNDHRIFALEAGGSRLTHCTDRLAWGLNLNDGETKTHKKPRKLLVQELGNLKEFLADTESEDLGSGGKNELLKPLGQAQRLDLGDKFPVSCTGNSQPIQNSKALPT